MFACSEQTLSSPLLVWPLYVEICNYIFRVDLIMKDIDSVHLMNSYFIRLFILMEFCVVKFVGSDMYTRTHVCTYVCTYWLKPTFSFVLCTGYVSSKTGR